MKNDSLVLITNNFPFGKGETFIENEIKYLSKTFEKIVIISHSIKDKQTRNVPKNVILERYDNSISPVEKIKSLKYIFSPLVKDEIKFIKNGLKLHISIHKIKTLLIALYKAKKIQKDIDFQITKHNLNIKTTVFYTYWMDDNALSLVLNSSIKKICRVHGWDLFFERNTENYLPFRNFILKNLVCFSISEKGVVYLKNKTMVNIKLSRLGTKNLNRNILKKDSLKRIVSCSNIIPLKRVDLIIKSLALLKTKDIEWIHFGTGVLEDTIKELALKNKINFELKGYVSNETILDYLQNEPIDLFINLSTTEGIPVSIMEAYSCGIPAIATDVGGTSEIVNNENGVLLKANPTKEEIVIEITNFFELSEKEIQKKRQNAYNTWKEKFNAEKNYTEFTEIISNL